MGDVPSFGVWLKRRRKALDLTQDGLAQLVGCAVVTIRKLEAEVQPPSRQLAERLAEHLAIPEEQRATFVQFARQGLDAAPPELPLPEEARVPEPRSAPLRLPSGTVTFLFSDIEGSARLWEQHAEAMPDALARHDAILRAATEAHSGVVFRTVGDAFCIAFANAPCALRAALDAQRALQREAWGAAGSLRVRMALHSGAVEVRDGEYHGQPLNRIARLLASGHGGQTLLSLATEQLVRDHLPADVTLRDLGTHRLKDLTHPEQIFELVTLDVPSDFPALKTLNRRRHNLPAQLTQLIGRERETAQVCALLRRADVRLVTLTGPGGIGKTRLALQAAAELLDTVADGVVFVDVAPISDPAMVVSTIAEALGLKETVGQPLIETLKRYLRERELLLLLDNFEQVVDAAAVVAELLKAAHTFKVLVTSRTVLHLSGEHDFVVHPLSLPDRQPPPPFDQFYQYAAVALFIERGQTVLPNFQLTTMNAGTVAGICQRLDGLPLALELAAARLKLFAPEELLARLERRLPILTGGPRDLPARQQTLRSTIAWSYDLLSELERIVLRRLAVFIGGWSLEAAEAICMGESIPAWELVELVAQLVHKSLVTVERYRNGSRYRMLETIREYAHEKLVEAGEERAIKARHCTFFTDWTEELEPKLRGAEQMIWLDRLEAEHDNLRAALAWSLSHDSQTGLRLAGGLGWFWRIHSHFSEGRRWLDAACTTSGVPPSLRVKALVHAALLAYNQDSPRSTLLFQESLSLSRHHSNEWGIGWSLQGLGRVAHQQGAYERAVTFLKQSLAPLRTLGDDSIAYSVYFLGLVAQDQGDYTQAAAFLRESLAMTQEAGDTWLTAWTLTHLGQIAYARREYAEANAYFAEGLMLFQALRSTWAVLRPLEGLALVAAAQGMLERLVRLLGFVAPLRETLGIAPYESEQTEFDRLLALARHELESDAFEAAWAAGHALALQEAIAEALAEA